MSDRSDSNATEEERVRKRGSADNADADAEHNKAVRDDAEARKDLEAPRSPEQMEAEMGSHPDRDEVKARERRDREELGRASTETQSREMQDEVAERREREADENELR